jgi:hypothetical protein
MLFGKSSFVQPSTVLNSGIMHLTYRHDSDSHGVASLDSGEAGAPANEIGIAPEMIREVTSIISGADYRFEDARDVAMKIFFTVYLINFYRYRKS